MSRHVSSSRSSFSSDTVIDPEQDCASDTTLSDGDGHQDGHQDGSPVDSQFTAYPLHLLSACSAAGRSMCQYTQPLGMVVVDKTDGSRGELYMHMWSCWLRKHGRRFLFNVTCSNVGWAVLCPTRP